MVGICVGLILGVILGVSGLLIFYFYFSNAKVQDHFDRFDLTASIVAILLLVGTLLLGLLQYRSTERSDQAEQLVTERSSQTEELGRLIEASSDDRMSSRVLAISGLQEYAQRYPETREAMIRQMGATVRYLSRHRSVQNALESSDTEDELRVALGALRAMSRLEPARRMPYDIAGVNLLATPLPGLVMNSSFARATDFSNVSLRNAVFTCGSLESALMVKADLSGAKMRGVDISDLNLTAARGVETATFEDVYWDPARPPKLGTASGVPVVNSSSKYNAEDPSPCEDNFFR